MKLSSLLPQMKADNKVALKKTEEDKSAKAPAESGKQDSELAADRVDLSGSSREAQKMQAIIQETPDMRLEKIQAIKEKIDSGDYKIDPQKVAGKMLTSLLTDSTDPE
ncbi:MAG: flagellar biosynthesis anti-sigma factor FlgM [Proteobacteria bacterium]|nr:flagellar biosynthesis anti-sigma factor FlgM [Pseudomonadota bacterium]MBU1716465.1 flagellar biosynthesis anti-sigma factor FlgM [Pseudomonadota bacterium]